MASLFGKNELRETATKLDKLLLLFEKYHLELAGKDSEIAATEREIDLLAYKLNSITQERIATIEGSGK